MLRAVGVDDWTPAKKLAVLRKVIASILEKGFPIFSNFPGSALTRNGVGVCVDKVFCCVFGVRPLLDEDEGQTLANEPTLLRTFLIRQFSFHNLVVIYSNFDCILH